MTMTQKEIFNLAEKYALEASKLIVDAEEWVEGVGYSPGRPSRLQSMEKTYNRAQSLATTAIALFMLCDYSGRDFK